MDWSALFGGRPRLPRECTCGDVHNEICPEIGLHNHRNFPPFAYLPEENDLDETYYGPDDDSGFLHSPIRHWALVGEIIHTNFFVRPRVTIRTRFGEEVLVNFHLEGARKPTFFDWSDLQPKNGGTACLIIFYPLNRTFLDMKQGVRQENPDSVMAFPVGLEDLATEVQRYSGSINNTDVVVCSYCGRAESDTHKLSRCTRCRTARYCGRDCQVSHWRKSHKKLCKHSNMLFKLANLDFSTFHDYVDWNFVVKDPPSPEEKEKRSKKAMRDFLYEMRASDPQLSSMSSRLQALLSSIESKTLDTDPVIQQYQESNQFVRELKKDDPEAAAVLCASVGESLLVQSLRSFCQAVTNDPDLRHHVVDLRLPRSRGSGIMGGMSHFVQEEVLDSVLFALPIWQHEASIGEISWAFESHGLISRSRVLYEGNSGSRYVWDVSRCDSDAIIVKNRISGTCVFAHDNMSVIADVSDQMATDRPHETIIRVIRVTANESWEEEIRKIATARDVPDNIYTLWIREEVPVCGRFNPPREEPQTLVEKLLDRERLSHAEMILREFGVNPSNILRSASRNTEDSISRETRRRGPAASINEDSSSAELDMLECAACGRLKPKDSFSRNQLKTKGAFARCKVCIQGSIR